jgi:5-formyltetrahydrofolate cyclo-ligase family
MVEQDPTGLKAQYRAELAAWREQVRAVEQSELQRRVQQLEQQQAAKPTVASVVRTLPSDMPPKEVLRELARRGLKVPGRTTVWRYRGGKKPKT